MLFQAVVKDVQDGVLAGVTSGSGITASMAVWTVTGIVIVLLHVGKVVLTAHVNDGMEPAHRVTTGNGARDVINNAVEGVKMTRAIFLMVLAHLASPVIGVSTVISAVKEV